MIKLEAQVSDTASQTVHTRAPLAQLVEHRTVTREVVNLTPAGATLRVLK